MDGDFRVVGREFVAGDLQGTLSMEDAVIVVGDGLEEKLNDVKGAITLTPAD